MDAEFALDLLVDYAVHPDASDRLLVNSAWRTLNREVNVACIQLRKTEAVFGRVRDRNAAEVERTQEEYKRLCSRRRNTPRKTRLPQAKPAAVAYYGTCGRLMDPVSEWMLTFLCFLARVIDSVNHQ